MNKVEKVTNIDFDKIGEKNGVPPSVGRPSFGGQRKNSIRAIFNMYRIKNY